MVLTEAELRELWRDGRNPLPPFPPGTRFSPAAHDFLNDHGLTPVFADPGPARPISDALPPASSDQPLASFVARLDALHALAGLVAAEARRAHLPDLAARLDALTAYCEALHASAREGRPAPALAWASAPPEGAGARPGSNDHAVAHWLNYLRASAQEAAVAAPEGMRAGLLRVAEAATELLGRFLSGELAWKVGG
jgi:hypothetical protein